jgi:hypothetical protein
MKILKIPKRSPEAINRRTDNTMDKKKRQTNAMIYKTHQG